MADRLQAGQRSWEGEMFRLLVENARDYAIFVVDGESRVQSWNPGAERLLGYRAEEVVGQLFDIFFTPEDIQAGVPQREMQQAIAVDRGDDDRWHVRKDGSRFWCGGTMTPLWDEGRTLRGFAKIMRDRTEWKRAEDAAGDGERLAAFEKATERKVAENEVRFQAQLLDAVGQAAIATDPEGQIIYWNRFAETLYGWSREEVIHRNILEVTPAPDLMKQASEVMDRLLSGETCSREFLVRRRDGTTFPSS